MIRARLVWEQPVLTVVSLPNQAQILQEPLRQRNQPLLVPFANHPQCHRVLVYVAGLERHRLADAQPAAVHHRENAPVQRRIHRAQQGRILRVGYGGSQALLGRGANAVFFSKAQSRRMVVTKKHLNA